MYFIYAIENCINGKRYIGQTTNPSDRKRKHFSCSSKCPYLSNAIQKYGQSNFDFILLEEHDNLGKTNRREKYWIRELKTLSPNGYNLREGGDAGGKPSLETREKMRQAQLGKKQSKEQIEKRVAFHRGRKNTPETIEKMKMAARNRLSEKCSMFGKKHSAETRRKMSMSHMKIYCKRGHSLEGENADVWVSTDGKRDCRACRRTRRKTI